ncbi:fibronectin type 3 and ankyrin repeat domains protein 1-like [Chanos chanos]|uniref:Fibronectin type 3 and ankyrin repeat domains protein 1-like n=1 Tax=Chanos chanos TaxID=29144 RepID=A0A6J2WG87_CHACN|nr:fibronectin type 3 and ankyrin repeat domains protein 1-like [Chanos chanos]
MATATLNAGNAECLVTPAPLVVGKVSHCSIELRWKSEGTEGRTGRPEHRIRYRLEEIEPETGIKGIIYVGYGTCHVVQGLEAESVYKFRLKVIRESSWECVFSSVLCVSTAREQPSGRNLHQVVSSNDEKELIKILQSGTVNVNGMGSIKNTPLMVAAQNGFSRLVCVLLEHGADVKMRDSDGKDSLMLACCAGHLDVVKTLLKSGASWRSRDAGGCTPLHWAAEGGHVSIVEYLIQDGCEVNVRDWLCRRTPLMRVAEVSGNTAVASLLIHAGADVNIGDQNGKTPLMAAVVMNHEALVKLLLDSGADCDMKDKFGSCAAKWALACERQVNENYFMNIFACIDYLRLTYLYRV